MDSPYLTVKEVASFLKKSPKWVYARQAQIPGRFKLAGAIFFDRDILQSNLKELASKPAKRPARTCPDKHGLT